MMQLETTLQSSVEALAEDVSCIHRRLANDCHNNMQLFSDDGCCLSPPGAAGTCTTCVAGGRVYLGATWVVDFSTHAHYDENNMVDGTTAIIRLLKPKYRDQQVADKEQYHCLPLYRLVVVAASWQSIA